MNWKKSIYILSVLLLMAQPSCAQYDDGPVTDTVLGVVDTSFYRKYDYIRYAYNKFFFPDESPLFLKFMQRFDTAVNEGKRKLNVYHIGGSHIQADIYTNEIRKYIQDFGPGLKTARGWIFPFTMLGTNNPGYYKVEHTGKWDPSFCTRPKDSARTGLLGVSATTHDSISSIKIYYRKEEQMYYHNRVKVYYEKGHPHYKAEFLPASLVKSVHVDTVAGFTEFELKKYTDTLHVRFLRTEPDSDGLTCYGFELLGDQGGVCYNTIGVNGASFMSYLRCKHFEEQLRQTPPDMFIISIGTNDANTDKFDPSEYERNYTNFINIIRRVNPNCAILLTVTNDCYYYRRYPNRNTALMRDVIYKLAAKYKYGVWDFYAIMGGFGSSQRWYKDGLMHRDRIHFSFRGYQIKGALFYEAFLKYLEEYEFMNLVEQGKKH